MSETEKLIIEIPKPMYESVQNGTYCGTLYEELKNGVPLDDVKAEIKTFTIAEKSKYDTGFNDAVLKCFNALDNIGKESEVKPMERSNKDIVKDMREIVKPFISDCLKRVNYEGKGDIDKAEFETEFEKVLTLAEKAETLSEFLDKISAEIKEKAFTEEIFDEETFKSTYTENMTREEAEEESVIETEIVKLSDILEIIEKNMKGENNA